jgi:hypothetical protein
MPDPQTSSQEERARTQSLDEFAIHHEFHTVPSLLDAFQKPPFDRERWAFRGQGDWTWRLEPTIERIPSAGALANFQEIDTYVMGRFKERAHHYIDHPPDWDDDLEWRALARHYGAPSRLLDCTRSPYVAAFFAVTQAKPDADVDLAVWAIDIAGIKSQAVKVLQQFNPRAYGDIRDSYSLSAREQYRRIFPGHFGGPHVVAPLQPSRTNERMIAQQALFFMANTPTVSGFEEDLKFMLISAEDPATKTLPPWLHKIRIKPSLTGGPGDHGFRHYFLLRELNRMNINHASLQPGLDGFAGALNVDVRIFDPNALHLFRAP